MPADAIRDPTVTDGSDDIADKTNADGVAIMLVETPNCSAIVGGAVPMLTMSRNANRYAAPIEASTRRRYGQTGMRSNRARMASGWTNRI